MARILLIDDNLLVRHMLKIHIELSPDLEVVGVNETGGKAVDLVFKYKPDITVVDLDMPGSTGRKIVEELHQAVPDIPIIATSLNDSQINVTISREAGAVDFVVKQANSVDLIKAIRQAISLSLPKK